MTTKKEIILTKTLLKINSLLRGNYHEYTNTIKQRSNY